MPAGTPSRTAPVRPVITVARYLPRCSGGAVVPAAARAGIGTFTLRALAEALGQSTRVLTHHFADKSALLAAVLGRAGRTPARGAAVDSGVGGSVRHGQLHREIRLGTEPRARRVGHDPAHPGDRRAQRGRKAPGV
ncbi:TetR family transcriptional regulator [Streptomyces sp. H27-D2]|uniref:TetR family transcriptional regulator n=1 Tax=Streptomyces sp. H27-D2 TaxID=3046304 RepID=UPI003FA724F8